MHFYYGDTARYHNETMNVKGVVHAWGEDIGVVEMSTKEDLVAYGADHKEIKTAIAGFFDLHRQNRITRSKLDDMLATIWIPLTMTFMDKWGADHVAYDIRRSIGNVRKELGMPPIVWPKILVLELATEGGVRVPVHVNEFGKEVDDSE